MVRQTKLVIVMCGALVAGVMAPQTATATHNDPAVVNGGGVCDGKAHGIWSYDGESETLGALGDLDLGILPGGDGNPNTRSTIRANAVMCGSDVDAGEFYTQGTLTYPNIGEKLRCARPGQYPVSRCDLSGDGHVGSNEKTAEGSYVGEALSAAICTGPNCPESNALDLSPTAIYVRFAGSGNDHCNSRSTDLIACFQSEAADILGVACDSDIVVTRASVTDPYKMTMYSPECSVTEHTDLNPLYLAAVIDLTMCTYASAVDGTECGRSGKWLFTTGAGEGDFTLSTGGGGLEATASKAVTW